jgi:predicted O-methyltransferase YrrM
MKNKKLLMSETYQLQKIKNLLSNDEQRKLYNAIDKIQEDLREWDKVDVLLECEPYLYFLEQATLEKREVIEKILKDYQHDDQFKKNFIPYLTTLGNVQNAGDLRFHAITLYVIARALKPENIIETGVAQGKSSAILLLALETNKKGRLCSIDLPNPTGKKLADGAFTSTGQRDIGWMVPDYLRSRWDLILGDAKIELPKALKSMNKVDIFFHDSLHTYEHVQFEIETVKSKMKDGVIIVDNLETEAGKFFEEFIQVNGLTGFAFSNLGVIRL